MLKKLKNFKLTKRGVYISLAICMLLVGGLGIYSAVKSMSKIISEGELGLEDLETVTDPIEEKELPKTNESETTLNETEIIPVVLNFTSPVAGEVGKVYSGSELVFSETMEDYRTHSGVDIYTEDLAVVVSVEEGEIVSIIDDPLWGTCVEVSHANGFTSIYKNLSDDIPEGIDVGSYISSGGVIGSVGSTALVEIGEAPHLHFEMTLNGEKVDPLEYVSFE